MRVIDRLHIYLKHHHIAPYTFERSCNIANGYLKKQMRGKGTIGSEILEKILATYKDISLNWLLTGTGSMLQNGPYTGKAEEAGPENRSWSEEEISYLSNAQVIKLLREKVAILENAMADKDKIIRLLEARMHASEDPTVKTPAE